MGLVPVLLSAYVPVGTQWIPVGFQFECKSVPKNWQPPLAYNEVVG
jgi:hypothetical protein